MYKAIWTRRSRRGATVWMVNWLHPLLVAFAAGPALFAVLVSLVTGHWSWWCLGLVTLVPTTARLRIAAGDPGTLRVTRSWLLIPYDGRHVALDQVTADYADLDSGDTHDLLRADGWEFECRDADGLLVSLRTARAELATPTALARR